MTRNYGLKENCILKKQLKIAIVVMVTVVIVTVPSHVLLSFPSLYPLGH
jgi:hypothetical protein